MQELVARNLEYEPSHRLEGRGGRLFAENGEHLKVELIEEKAGQTLSCYKLGDLVDFCTGPHVLSTGSIDPDSFRVLSLAGSYWKGDEHRERLQRIYGTAFLTPRGAGGATWSSSKRRRSAITGSSGRELDLFSISEEAGPGLHFLASERDAGPAWTSRIFCAGSCFAAGMSS